MNEAEVQKTALEKAIQEKSQKVVTLSEKLAKQPIDNLSGSKYSQSVNELSQVKKALKGLTKEYMTLLKGMYRK